MSSENSTSSTVESVPTNADAAVVNTLVQDLDAVGESRAEILSLTGFTSLQDVAQAPVYEVKQLPCFGEKTARDAVVSARKALREDDADDDDEPRADNNESDDSASIRRLIGHCQKDNGQMVYIGRSGSNGQNDMTNTEIGERGWLGNPFEVGEDGTREEVVAKFEQVFSQRIEDDPQFADAVASLAGKRLGCWCQQLAERGGGAMCHGEIIAAYAQALDDRQNETFDHDPDDDADDDDDDDDEATTDDPEPGENGGDAVVSHTGNPTGDRDDVVAVVAPDGHFEGVSNKEARLEIVRAIDRSPFDVASVRTAEDFSGIRIQDVLESHNELLSESKIGAVNLPDDPVETPWGETTDAPQGQIGQSQRDDGTMHHYWEEAPSARNERVIRWCDGVVVIEADGFVENAMYEEWQDEAITVYNHDTRTTLYEDEQAELGEFEPDDPELGQMSPNETSTSREDPRSDTAATLDETQKSNFQSFGN